MRHILFFIAVLLSANSAFAAKPGLIVTPTRIIMEGKNRSAVLSIANNGDAEGVYRVSLVNRRMTENGKIVNIEEAGEGELFADSMLRVSPRRIVIAANSHQTVRILARKPKGLASGEYRSHLNIMILPVSSESEDVSESDVEDKKLSIILRANYGVTIPVIVRHGTLEVDVNIDNIALVDGEEGQKKIKFTLNRSGQKSVYGDIKVVYINENGEEIVIKSLGGLAVYTPNKKRNLDITLNIPENISIDGGKIKVIYSQKEKAGGKVMASGLLPL